jgi:hypothetical protein
VLGALLKEEVEVVRESGVWWRAEDGGEQGGSPRIPRRGGDIARPLFFT